MKTEHRDIIDRARLAGLPPSYLAHELLVHDLVEAGLFELKNLHSPYGKLNEGQQQEVIDRLTEAAEKAVHNAISIISSRNVSTIEVTMKEVKFNSKQLTLTSIVDAKDPNRHDLIDSAGRICLLVMAPDDYSEGLDFIQPDRDQKDLPLHVSDLTGSLFPAGGTGPDEPDGQNSPLGTEQELNALVNEGRADIGKEFGEFTYDDAAQLIVLKAAEGFGIDWMQSRLAISSQQAETLLLRLIDNEVVELVAEGDTWTENTYKVIASLE
jgi:S-DNA-T family DNA segregation ATPase FtsK/SpoIIIE